VDAPRRPDGRRLREGPPPRRQADAGPDAAARQAAGVMVQHAPARADAARRAGVGGSSTSATTCSARCTSPALRARGSGPSPNRERTPASCAPAAAASRHRGQGRRHSAGPGRRGAAARADGRRGLGRDGRGARAQRGVPSTRRALTRAAGATTRAPPLGPTRTAAPDPGAPPSPASARPTAATRSAPPRRAAAAAARRRPW
jgi:hypothetical protein